MENLPNFDEFLNEDEKPLNEGIDKGLDYYYSNSEKPVRERAKKIDAILNKEIKSDTTKKALLDLIKEIIEDYAIEYHDNARPW